MAEKSIDETFAAIFALIDLRQIFRETKPIYQLSIEQKEKIKEILRIVRQSLDVIEKELIT